jgi:hypothetical protein
MQSNLVSLTYEIEIRPGDKLELPEALVKGVGPGRWVLNVRPAGRAGLRRKYLGQNGFLNSYAPEDEGLYDDGPTR